MQKKTKRATHSLVPVVQANQSTRTIFTEQFKLDAVRRMQEPACSPTALALELGIRRNQLYKWAAALKHTGAVLAAATPTTADPTGEIARLRRQLLAAQEENAILKKFDAYLTKR